MGVMPIFVRSPEQREAHNRRREATRAAIERVMRVKQADLGVDAAGWNITDADLEHGMVIGKQAPALVAEQAARRVLSQLKIPTVFTVDYKRTVRASGSGAHGIDEGRLWVQAKLKSISGPEHYIDIPLEVRRGKVLAPTILFYEQTPHIIAQQTIDTILGLGEFKREVLPRKTMFHMPQEGLPKTQVHIQHPGMFFVGQQQATQKRAYTYVPGAKPLAVPGQHAKMLPGIDESHLDLAERAYEGFSPGDVVQLRRDVTIYDAGGSKYTLKRGMEGEIVRDLDQTGQAFYVRFPSFGHATVRIEDLK